MEALRVGGDGRAGGWDPGDVLRECTQAEGLELLLPT